MLTGRIKSLAVGLLVAVLASGLTLGGHPAQARIQTLKKSAHGPDLAIKRVWMGPDCRLRVRLVNAGKKPVKIKSPKLPALSIQLDKTRPRLFTFAQVDPKGRLGMPGGWVVFIAPRFSARPKSVLVTADPKNLIPESDERNNRAKLRGPLGRCRASSTKLPLTVHSAFIKKGTLHVRLMGAKVFKPTRKDLLSIKLKVGILGQRRSWTLTKVDPMGKLRSVHRVEFNTHMKVKPGSAVKTLLLWVGGQRSKDFTALAEAPPSRRARLTGRRGAPAASPRMRAMTTAAIMSAARRVAGPTGNITYMSLDSGIHISTPREGQTVGPGGTLRVRYRLLRSGGLQSTRPSPISFFLYRGSQQVAETSGTYSPLGLQQGSATFYHTFNWQLPVDLEHADNYHVLIRKDGAWSLSDAFRIGTFGDAGPGTPTAWEIRLVTPGRNPVFWPRGATKTIAWRIDGSYPENREFIVRLMRGGGRVLAIEGTPRWHANAHSYSLDWTIPPDLTPASDYRIKVADRNGPTEGWSESDFTITGPIEVLYPPGTRYIANPTQIRWRLAPGSGIRNVRIALVDSSDNEVLEIAHGVGATQEEYNWVVGANYKRNDGTWEYQHSRGSWLNGDRYAIRVMDANDHGNYGQSQHFIMMPAYINVWTSESSCHHGVRVHWESSDLHESVRLQITVRYLWTGTIAHSTEDPMPADNHAYIYISNNARSSGNFCWEFGTCASGTYPRCAHLPDPLAQVVAWPKGFRWYPGVSPNFRLDDHGCRR